MFYGFPFVAYGMANHESWMKFHGQKTWNSIDLELGSGFQLKVAIGSIVE